MVRKRRSGWPWLGIECGTEAEAEAEAFCWLSRVVKVVSVAGKQPTKMMSNFIVTTRVLEWINCRAVQVYLW